MKKFLLGFIILLFFATGFAAPNNQTLGRAAMKISSPAFKANETIPTQFTCDGKDFNPSLVFSDLPTNAKSLALIVDDPDAPVGDWVHWLVWNIAPNTTKIDENSTPQNTVTGTNDFGKTQYGGPCPPAGSPHHYHFKLYALDSTLELPADTNKAALLKAMQGHIIELSELVGLYQR